MGYFSGGDYVYLGWGWILWLGLVLFMISGVSHWGHAYLNHRKNQDDLKIDSKKADELKKFF